MYLKSMNSMEHPPQIHEIRRKSMRGLSAPLSAPFGRRQNSIRKKKAQREVLPGGIRRIRVIRGDKGDKGDKGG